MLGLVVAGGFELMDDRMHSEKEIKDLMPVGVMVEIPEVLNFSDQEKIETESLAWVGLWQGWWSSRSWRGRRSAICAGKFFIHVQGFLQSHAESVRAHARSGISVRDQATQ